MPVAELTASFEGPGLHRRIGGMLGLSAISSDEDLVHAVEHRLPLEVLAALGRNGFEEAELFDLVLPRRTLAHRRGRGEPLTAEESDRAVRLARIAALTERVFGDAEKAHRWLRRRARRFGGRAPLQIIATEAGARLVEELLYQIDEGYFA
jgi:putative toxin-antitoxin system antitoxin component (TIGR02293 family)